jgi:hypothetical protein
MRTTDNNGGKPLAEIGGNENIETFTDDLSEIANKNIFELQKDNPDLLVFPKGFDTYHDDIGKLHICSIYNDKDAVELDYKLLWELRLKPLLKEYLRGMPNNKEHLGKLHAAFDNSYSGDSEE